MRSNRKATASSHLTETKRYMFSLIYKISKIVVRFISRSVIKAYCWYAAGTPAASYARDELQRDIYLRFHPETPYKGEDLGHSLEVARITHPRRVLQNWASGPVDGAGQSDIYWRDHIKKPPSIRDDCRVIVDVREMQKQLYSTASKIAGFKECIRCHQMNPHMVYNSPTLITDYGIDSDRAYKDVVATICFTCYRRALAIQPIRDAINNINYRRKLRLKFLLLDMIEYVTEADNNPELYPDFRVKKPSTNTKL